jgi:hypothetical protein
MLEISICKAEQIRLPTGMAFWSFSAEMLKDLRVGLPNPREFCWEGREWIWKRDERTLNEVIGYQIALTIGLPLQPWLAFESPAPRSISMRAGMFVEWWTSSRLKSCLIGLGSDHEALVARSLAFSVFGRAEWPEWLLSEDKKELRLIDLDGTGPIATVPPNAGPRRDYVSNSESVFNSAR